MKPLEVTKILSLITTAFQTVEMTDEFIALWETMLKDVDYALAAQNLHKHMLSSKYPPTIADIAANNGVVSATRKLNETQERLALISSWDNAVYLPEGRGL
ncbi:replicative helicase loader/inhibitor [Paenibacillus sp. ACRRX]|uniref:replicative helicase loader/inhibitor n=1 Tax=Paenibacillus sp. ACRRX TaxID=2918206 RepID=UPI001EF703BC|nr:replicative helicase loader/inhibitor [Paenibacillus sp. ACRRX]MCG7410593.1 replicative helicase loader/inhibitor [Paenibacillus sp. ACRRX]